MSNNKKITYMGLWIWGLCALFFTYEFMLRTLLGTFEHPLLQDLKLSLVAFSILSSTAYQAIYGVMQIPAGIILDKMGLKKILTYAILICSCSVIGFSFTHEFKSAFVFRLLMGLGSSFGFIGLLVAVYDWMPSSKSGLFIGLSQLIGTLGPMIAAGPMNSLAEGGGLSWQVVFFSLGILGLFLSLLIFIFVKNNRDFAGSFQILRRPEPLKLMLFTLVRQPQVWFIGIYSASIYFAIEYLSENSGKSFLMLNGYSSQSASNFITLSWLGYAVGCPLLGFLSDFFCRRKLILILASIICLISGFLIFYMPQYQYLLTLGFLGLGLGASGQSVAFATIAEQCKSNYLAAGLGFNNACVVIIASLNAPLIALLLNNFKQHHSQLTISDYQSAFLILLGFMALSFIVACFFIKETYCKSRKSATMLQY